MTSAVDYLQSELSHWKEAGMCPRLFMRDDDCIDVTPALEKMVSFIEQREITLLLAVIPKHATHALGKYVGDHELLLPAVHGYFHTNHAPDDQKKCEYCDNRDRDEMLDEMKRGHEILQDRFGNCLSPLFVPPWNRIGEKAVSTCAEAGFTGISGFGWKTSKENMFFFNTHVDVIDWKGGKVMKPLEALIKELRANLSIARERNFAPVGILTHHLVHEEWELLGELFDVVGEIKWIGTGATQFRL